MLEINSEIDSPNYGLLRETVEEIADIGIKIADTRELEAKLTNALNKHKDDLREYYGIENPNSSKQVLASLQELAQIEHPCIYDVCYNEDTGKWTSNAEALETLKTLGVPIAFTLSRYRELNNIISTLRSLRDLSDASGMVHPVVSYGRTRRINYSEPALMNINKKVLWDVIAPRSAGWELWSVDIKNEEPWILINMLGIGTLMEILEQDRSLYDCVFEYWYGHEPSKEERAEFKTAWNALTYGASKKLIQSRCNAIDGGMLFKNFNGIKELKEWQQTCRSKGFGGRKECETYFGTKLECDAYRGAGLARQQMDYPIQGTGVDILALLNEYFQAALAEQGLEDSMYVYMFRHDEMVIAVDENLRKSWGYDKVESFLRDIFELKIDNWLPFNVEIELLEKNDSLLESLDIS